MISPIESALKGRRSAESFMKMLTWIIAAMVLMPYQAMSQGPNEKYSGETVQCASDIIHNRMMDEDPAYRQRFQEMERSLEHASSSSDNQRMVIYTIPVVVHVMHSGELLGTGVNITDSQIQSAIDALNEDYRKMQGTNGFGGGVDVEVEFCLASRDPQGNPTNGINRINASSLANYSSQGISVGQGSGASETGLKALSRWDRNDYYNIWIVNEIEDNDGGAGIQGFAYFPSSSADRDGAVILYNAFGTLGNLKSYTSLNRTTTHELGHAFNLYHTFQGNSCSESNCSTEGDRVCDTPPTTSSNSCASPACSGTQQVENYMDYTSQTCMDMFTAGQKSRMRTAITSQRGNLLNSLACTPPNALDAGISRIISPSGFSCSSSFSPIVELSNYGSSTLTSVNIKYRVDNGTLQTYTYTGNLASGAHIQVTIPGISAATGSHTLTVYTQSPNGQSDGYPSNDTNTSSFSVVAGNTVTVAILADNYGNETTWEVSSSSGALVQSGGPYPSGLNGTTFEHEFCLAEGCYDFTIFDSYGDGLCCGGGFGGYSVTDQDGGILAESGVDFTDSETTSFCVTAPAQTGSAPNANFSVNQTQACVGSTFQFTDLSTGAATSRTWTFQGGNPATSTAANPSVVFNGAGTHNVTLNVSNAYGSDTELRNNYITSVAPIVLNASTDAPSCWNSTDGSVDLSLTGGMAPYSYNWNTGIGTQDLNYIGPGTYSVTAVGSAGCTSTASVTITAPPSINASNASSTPASCTNEGSATVSPTGGTPGYSYLWNDPSSQNTQTAMNLAGGDYTVVITDANGCQKTKNITVTSSGGVNTSSAGLQNVTCYGNANGSATVTATGGQAPYTYQWNDPSSQTTATASGLAAGTFGVQVTDADGCASTRAFTITQPTALTASLTGASALCFGSANGGIQATMSGGTAPYSYNWNGADFGQTLNPSTVAAGSYTFNMTDANGCSTSSNVAVSQPADILVTILSTTPDSCQLDVGTAEIDVTGGMGSFTAVWSDEDAQQGFFLQGVRHGAYTVMVQDQNACTKNKTANIGEVDCLGTSGLEDQGIFSGLNLYPNPVHGHALNIDLGEIPQLNIKATLLDITGQSVRRMQLPMGIRTHQFTVGENVAEGIYLMQLTDGISVITQRVMVIR